MTKDELAEFREWFRIAYPSSKMVLRRAYVEEWRRTKETNTRKAVPV